MKEYKTLNYPNTTNGQQQKIRDMNRLTNQGWMVVSENISSGQFKGKTACCYALICLPLGFAAGSTDGEIVVTYERETNGHQSGDALQTPKAIPVQHQSMKPFQFKSEPVVYDDGDDAYWDEVRAKFLKAIDSGYNAVMRLAEKVPLLRQHKWLLPAAFYLAIAIVSYVVLASLSGGTPNAGH